jgi:hypothetical protein
MQLPVRKSALTRTVLISVDLLGLKLFPAMPARANDGSAVTLRLRCVSTCVTAKALALADKWMWRELRAALLAVFNN